MNFKLSRLVTALHNLLMSRMSHAILTYEPWPTSTLPPPPSPPPPPPLLPLHSQAESLLQEFQARVSLRSTPKKINRRSFDFSSRRSPEGEPKSSHVLTKSNSDDHEQLKPKSGEGPGRMARTPPPNSGGVYTLHPLNPGSLMYCIDSVLPPPPPPTHTYHTYTHTTHTHTTHHTYTHTHTHTHPHTHTHHTLTHTHTHTHTTHTHTTVPQQCVKKEPTRTGATVMVRGRRRRTCVPSASTSWTRVKT